MTKTELKKTVVKIKKFLKQRDYDAIDTSIELARGLDEPAVFEALLGGWSINEDGKLVLEEGYKGETLTKRWADESWSYVSYALWNLISYSPDNVNINETIKRENILKANILETELYSEILIKQFKNQTGLILRPNSQN